MDYRELTARLIKLNLVMKLYSSEELDSLGVHFSQTPILGYISQHPRCTQIEIAEALSVSPASIALSTKRMEKSGFIIKEIMPDNLRCKRLSLTDKGRFIYEKGISIRDEQDAQMYSGFSEEELVELSGLIDRLTINLTKEESNVIEHNVIGDLEKQIENIFNKN